MCCCLWSRRRFRRQDSERREAGGLTRRATDKVRAGNQFEDGETDRPDDSAECAARADKVIR